MTTGTFWTRVAKESLVIFPASIFCIAYYGYLRLGVMDHSMSKLLLYSSILTLILASLNARRPAPQPNHPTATLVPSRTNE